MSEFGDKVRTIQFAGKHPTARTHNDRSKGVTVSEWRHDTEGHIGGFKTEHHGSDRVDVTITPPPIVVKAEQKD